MRFVLTRRWIVLAVVVGLLTWLAVELGEWQFRRLDDRRETNVHLERNLATGPLPVADVMRRGSQPAVDDEWRQVTARGTYDDAATVVVRYRTRDSASGVDVVTPLLLDDGSAVLVDRGWMRSTNNAAERPDLPPATRGRVTVTGWVRRDATGSAAAVDQASTRAISSRTIGETLSYPLLGGFLELHDQVPGAEEPLVPVELPEISEGPHFFYGLQWWFFGALAVFGFGYLLLDEWRRRRREADEAARPGVGPAPPEEPDGPRSERAQLSPVDGQHHARDE